LEGSFSSECPSSWQANGRSAPRLDLRSYTGVEDIEFKLLGMMPTSL
jgi:hypothetical protein